LKAEELTPAMSGIALTLLAAIAENGLLSIGSGQVSERAFHKTGFAVYAFGTD
jgi:hypothetical protein